MKKSLLCVIFGVVAALSLFADNTLQVRLPLSVATPWSGSDLAHVTDAWNNGRDATLGMGTELIFDQIGFGVEGSTRFTRDADQLWTLDFRGQAFTSYHFFGVESNLDPFVLAGLGSAGWVDISRGVHPSTAVNLTGIALALVPSVGGGVAFDLGGLVIGARALWFPTAWDIPAAPIDRYLTAPAEVGVFVAWALVDHAK